MSLKSQRALSARVAAPQRGSLHHVRRSVLLLLGFYNVPLHTGIVRYAREADWILDDTYVRVGLPPVWWRGDGILGLITNIARFSKVFHRQTGARPSQFRRARRKAG